MHNWEVIPYPYYAFMERLCFICGEPYLHRNHHERKYDRRQQNRRGAQTMSKETCSAGHEMCLPNIYPGSLGRYCNLHRYGMSYQKHCIEGHPISQECKEAPNLTPVTEIEHLQELYPEALQREKMERLSEDQLNGLYIMLDIGSEVPPDCSARLKETLRAKDVLIAHWRKGREEMAELVEQAEAKVKELNICLQEAQTNFQELKRENERLKATLESIMSGELVPNDVTPKEKP